MYVCVHMTYVWILKHGIIYVSMKTTLSLNATTVTCGLPNAFASRKATLALFDPERTGRVSVQNFLMLS